MNTEFPASPWSILLITRSLLSFAEAAGSIPTCPQVTTSCSLISLLLSSVCPLKKCFQHHSHLICLFSEAAISWYVHTTFKIVIWSLLGCQNLHHTSATASHWLAMSKKSFEDADMIEMISNTSNVQPYSFEVTITHACWGSSGNNAICLPAGINCCPLSMASSSHNFFKADATQVMGQQTSM